MSIDVIISVAGWEERFEKGLTNDLKRIKPSKVLIFVFEDYREITRSNRTALSEVAASMNVEYREIAVTRDPLNLWRTVQSTLGNEFSGMSVFLNISTMPREVMWWTCLRLENLGSRISYGYYKPSGYASDWLTRDTGQPRLVYQLSGISSLGKPTCLLLLTGFDMARAVQIIEYFEPALVIVGIQVGTQFDNHTKNIEQTASLRQRAREVRSFNLDVMDSDRGLKAMDDATESARSQFNIIGASLGPKVSSLALYRLARTNPEMALAYAPSREFNPNYSFGIGEMLEGTLDLETEPHGGNL